MNTIKPVRTSRYDGWAIHQIDGEQFNGTVTLYPTDGDPVEIRDPQSCDTIMRSIRDAMYDKIVHDQRLEYNG